jgi:hypothetical protein
MPDKLREGYRKIMDLAVEAGMAKYVKRDGGTMLVITKGEDREE